MDQVTTWRQAARHQAVQALEPERVLLLPDGDEDLWNAEYAELVALA